MRDQISKKTIFFSNIFIMVFPTIFIFLGICFPYLRNTNLQKIPSIIIYISMLLWIVTLTFSFIYYQKNKNIISKHLRNITIIIISLSFILIFSSIVPFLFYVSFN